MKNVTISGVVAFVTGAFFTLLLICCFASCAASRPAKWYPKLHGGCQSSQGMPGY